MRKIQTLQKAERWLKYRLYPRALILMYHRIIDLPTDPQLLAVTPTHFAEQLEVIRKYGSPMRLQQLVEALQGGSVPDHAVVLTFDDGYADNLYYAKPLLDQYETPATVFVTAGHLAIEREFWWDALDNVLLQPGILSSKLHLNIHGSEIALDINRDTVYTEEDFLKYQDWHIERPDTPSERHHLYRVLYKWFYQLPDEHRAQAVEELFTWADVTAAARQTHWAMNANELLDLSAGEMVEIGAHTMTHPILSHLTSSAQRAEIWQSKELLESILNRPVKSFAIPHGESNSDTATILREEGFTAACSSEPDAIWRGVDCFHLPRVGVRDCSGEEFAGWLKRWVDG